MPKHHAGKNGAKYHYEHQVKADVRCGVRMRCKPFNDSGIAYSHIGNFSKIKGAVKFGVWNIKLHMIPGVEYVG